MSCNPSGSAIVSAMPGPGIGETSVMRFSSARGPDGGLYCGDGSYSQRCEGLCTLHFDVADAPPPPIGPPPAMVNAALKARVTWRSGMGDGMMLLDVVRGHMARVGGVDVVTVTAFFEPINPALPTSITPQRISVTALWKTSKGGIPAQYSPPGVLAAGGGGPFIAVPPQAARMLALTATAAGLLGLIAQFSTDGVTVTHEAPVGVSSADAVPVVQGARFVRFLGPAGLVFPVFQLWT
jgi:hypothetical protein